MAGNLQSSTLGIKLPPRRALAAGGFTARCAAWGAMLGLIGAAAPAAGPLTARLPAPASRQVDFATEVRPIFEQSCFRCHGPERPKSRFRLDNRAAALAGGSRGTAIIPGESARSALILYVARLDPEMTMPPEGKGEPLTTEQIATLRAWIDQGANWDGLESNWSLSVTPAVGFVTVQGNAAKFREHQWLRDGGRGGLESFSFHGLIAPETKLTLSGHALTDDYLVEGLLEQPDTGFTRFGFAQFRKYESDTGGYAATLNPASFNLGRDLHLDIGRAWFDVGLTLPDWPRLVLGYEYQYRTGEKATLQWGPVGTQPPDVPNTDARNIFPARKAIDEHTHVLKFDAEFERGGWRLEDSFRGEWTESRTDRVNANRSLIGVTDSLVTDTVSEGWQSFQGANIVRVEREFRDWLHGSAGHLYSRLRADADFSLETLNPAGLPYAFPQQSLARYSQRIVLEREAHVANANALLGPWQDATLTLGAQAGWTRQNGTAEGFYDTFHVPGLEFLNLHDPADFLADLDKATVEEHAAIRYTRLPFTTLFAEARWQQECLGHRERILADFTFERDTDARSEAGDFRMGFDSAPSAWLKFGSQFRYFDKATTFEDGDLLDQSGYPTFIEALDRISREVTSRITLRPARWLTTTFTHRLVATDYHTTTEAFAQSAANDVSPGGRTFTGNYDAQIISFNATLTPWRRLHWFTTVSVQDIRSTAAHGRSDAVAPYRGETWSVASHGRFVLNEKTDLTAGYTFSTADYRQELAATGLPLGMDYHLHGLQAGWVSHRTKHLTLKLQYGFYQYQEPGAGGFNDYTAHAVLAAVNARFP